MANVGVTFDFAAESAKLRAEVDKVRREMSSIKQSALALEKGFKTLGGFVAGAFSIGAITSFLSRINQAGDQLDGLSQRLSASASGLQTLQVAAAQAGGSAEAMNNALARMSVSLGDALAGNKLVNDALARLGLTAKELAGLKTDEAMRRISTALSEVGNSYERASISQAIFGKGAKDLQEFFAVAPGQISETEKALAAAGATLDDIDLAKIGAMNDALAMQTTIVDNLGIKFLAGLSPAVVVATDAFAELVSNLGGATEAGKSFGVIMVAALKSIMSGVYALAAVFETLRSVTARVMFNITTSVRDFLDLMARAADAAGLDVAGPLRSAAEVADGMAQSLDSIATRAWANAKAAGAAALQAAADVLNANAIFDEYTRKLEASAAAARDRAAAAQGVAAGTGGAAGAAGGVRPLPELESLKGAGREIDRELDVLSDPKVLRTLEINKALEDIQDQHNETMLGKVELFNQTMLGSVLNYGQLQIDAEQTRAQMMGQIGTALVNTAIQSGGKIGKFGKALAIAQTVWSTASAVIQSYEKAGGYPWGIAPAAAMLAIGLAQIANIKKTNIGSAGSFSTSGRGSTNIPTPGINDNVPGAQPQEARNVSQVIIQGNVFSSQETAEWIIGQIRDAVDTRDIVFISSNSRQAMELAGT